MTTSTRGIALACVTTTLLALPVVVRAQAVLRNQDTFFTFSQPVELPNATLPAGTYLFRLADSEGNRHIVRVMSQDRQKLFTTLFAIPTYSLARPPEKAEIRFMESPAAKANAIKIWFYPGNPVGHEFIYPRNQAVKLAKASGESVLTTKSANNEVSTSVADSDLTRVNPEGQDTEANMNGQRASANARSQTGSVEAGSATSTASASTASSSQTASASSTASQPSTTTSGAMGTSGRRTATDASASRAARDRQSGTAGATGTSGNANAATRTRRSLPRTAGMLPLIGLIGLGSVAGSRIIRRVRRA